MDGTYKWFFGMQHNETNRSVPTTPTTPIRVKSDGMDPSAFWSLEDIIIIISQQATPKIGANQPTNSGAENIFRHLPGFFY